MCVFEEPAGADVCLLDQMTVTNISDEEALDDFLNSTGDDMSTGSSLTSGKLDSVTLQHKNNMMWLFKGFIAASVVFGHLW